MREHMFIGARHARAYSLIASMDGIHGRTAPTVTWSGRRDKRANPHPGEGIANLFGRRPPWTSRKLMM